MRRALQHATIEGRLAVELSLRCPRAPHKAYPCVICAHVTAVYIDEYAAGQSGGSLLRTVALNVPGCGSGRTVTENCTLFRGVSPGDVMPVYKYDADGLISRSEDQVRAPAECRPWRQAIVRSG